MNGAVFLAIVGVISIVVAVGVILYAIDKSLKSFKEPKGIF